MKIRYRPLGAWTDPVTKDPQRSPFKATWSDTLDLLDREISHLNRRGVESVVVIQVDVPERAITRGETINGNYGPNSPRVVVTIETTKHGPLRYAVDAFDDGWSVKETGRGWKANVRAVALALENLRAVDRYGVAGRGQQYTGFQALGAGVPMGAKAEQAMTVDQAWRTLIDAAGCEPSPFQAFQPAHTKSVYRLAARNMHPDTPGGSDERFKLVDQAYRVLTSHTKGTT